MQVLRSLRQRAAIVAVAAGFAVYAASLVGLASIDDDLRAAGLTPTAEFVRVSHELPADTDADADRGCSRDDDRGSSLDREL